MDFLLQIKQGRIRLKPIKKSKKKPKPFLETNKPGYKLYQESK